MCIKYVCMYLDDHIVLRACLCVFGPVGAPQFKTYIGNLLLFACVLLLPIIVLILLCVRVCIYHTKTD